MPTSVTGNRRLPSARPGTPAPAGRDGGFTLIELMVVVTIIGLASAVVVWSLPDPNGRVHDEALRFAARVRAAHDSAIVDGQPMSVWATAGGYGFDRRIGNAWVPVAEKPLRVERWAEGSRSEFDDRSGRLRITFDTTGLPDRAADIRVRRGDAAALVRIGADGNVGVDAG